MAGSFIVELDLTGLQIGAERLSRLTRIRSTEGITKIGNELLRLSQQEVPHDTGALQNSGNVDKRSATEVWVGYNKVYAARLHENPQYNFQGGRKGKYLEDPLKNNLNIFKGIYDQILRGVFR